jgi:predicted molibdopterin-dependent oxidoreductase YjgC
MGKHHNKIAKSLEIRQSNVPNKPGYKKPGSMNKKKTGYNRVKAKAAKQFEKFWGVEIPISPETGQSSHT